MRSLAALAGCLAFLVLACGKIRLPTEPAFCATDAGTQGQVSGSILTDGGSPVSDARITIGDRSGRTDAAGRFSLEAASGSAMLEIEAPGHLRATGRITVTSGSSALRAVLPASSGTKVLFGRVLEACSGRPIAGARVGLRDYFATSLSDGTYVLVGVGANTTLDFRVERSGYKTIGPGAFRLFGGPEARDFLMERAH